MASVHGENINNGGSDGVSCSQHDKRWRGGVTSLRRSGKARRKHQACSESGGMLEIISMA